MNNKIITLPISGRMRIHHSKRLEMALWDFVTSIACNYYDDELSNGIISLYFKLDNDICVEQKIYIRQKDYICYTILSCCIEKNKKEDIHKFIKVINLINRELDYGNFEINENTGDIIFKSIYEPDGFVNIKSLDKLIRYPRVIINRYGLKILESLRG